LKIVYNRSSLVDTLYKSLLLSHCHIVVMQMQKKLAVKVTVHYPIEALQNVPFADSKAHLLEIQKAEFRCLLSKSLLDHGFFSGKLTEDVDRNNKPLNQHCGYSWSGQREVPSYLNKFVFPEEFLSALRIISLQEHELTQVSALLEEVKFSHLSG
ncbi:hypothetical protein Taro_028105, partial [Colocasia esculenta]|nr:hypothetical protein [Colocasia esculenta]